MHKSIFSTLRYTALAGLFGLMTACATPGVTPEQLKSVESKVTSALSEARAAKSTAEAASAAASAAAEAAKQAQSTADAALACCNDNKSRIDNMFEQTMKK